MNTLNMFSCFNWHRVRLEYYGCGASHDIGLSNYFELNMVYMTWDCEQTFSFQLVHNLYDLKNAKADLLKLVSCY